MDCEKFSNYLDRFSDLTDDEMLEVTSHAAECERCADELKFMLSIIDTVRSLPEIKAPSDFMERLNDRIDELEAQKRVPRMLRNWRQYAALAACLALVAVLTANGKLISDRMSGTDDGVIVDETPTVTDSTTPVIPQELIAEVTEPTASADSQPDVSEPMRQAQRAKTREENTTSVTVTPKMAAGLTQPAVSVAPKTAATVAPVDTATVAEPDNSGIQTMSINDGIAVASYDGEDNISSTRTVNSRSALTGYTISGKQVTETAELEEPNVGRLKISPKDEKKAMEAIMKYSYEVDGDYYTTSPDNMVNIFCDLVDSGVEYANYIPNSEDSIRFQLIIG